MKLVLGTAQFGLPYGITRETDHVSDAALREILATAAELDVVMIDTAPVYGNAEARLGAVVPNPIRQVQTKTRGGNLSLTLDEARQDFDRSLARLRRPSVDSFLIHSVEQLFSAHGADILRFLLSLRDDGLAARVGVSVYDADDISQVLGMFTPDVVQVPVSVADQRLVDNGALSRLKDLGVCVQARSVFLQGALLTAPEDLPENVHFLSPHVARFRAETEDPPARCFGFLESIDLVDEVVFGVHSAVQLMDIVRAYEASEQDVPWHRCKFPSDVVDPRVWSDRA